MFFKTTTACAIFNSAHSLNCESYSAQSELQLAFKNGHVLFDGMESPPLLGLYNKNNGKGSMEMELKIFENEKYGKIRTVDKDGEPYFMASDVCKVLGLNNAPMAMGRIDGKDKYQFNLHLRGKAPLFVNESGLYDLILSSRKKEALQFKRWITAEVIPSIRKHGAYIQPEKLEEMLADPDTMIKTLEVLKEEREKRIEAENKVKGLEGIVQKAKPAVVFTKAVAASDDCIMLGQLAKLIKQNGVDIGEKRFFQWLRENGYLCHSDGNRNVPTQAAMNAGLFKIKEYLYTTAHGKEVMNRTTLATGKGQVYFINKLVRA